MKKGGARPTVFRRRAREVTARLGPPPEEMESSAYLQRAVTGRLEPERAAQLFDRLQAIFALLTETSPPGAAQVEDAAPDEPALEQEIAAKVWRSVRDRPFSQQRTLVRRQLYFRTPALFDLLRAESRAMGRNDRRRGVELAELALASLEGCARALGEDLPNRKIQGLIGLAKAHRRALDLPAAEQTFRFAEAEWNLAVGKRDPSVEAEFLAYQVESAPTE